jgi:glyoxylase I family protein|tara:strand:+ start:13471 stop:13824 length:354 start_codon:yes stop_codon:yes gene_type:complete
MEFSSIHHISINVADTAQATAFYVGILGFQPIQRPDLGFNGAWVQMGDQQLHLLEVENHEAPQGQHFAFGVADIELSRNYLMENGIKVSDPNELDGVCRQCFFKDPSGNLLELNQPM